MFTDPAAIGPSPDDAAFEVTAFEKNLLRLDDVGTAIGPMGLEDAITLKIRLNALREESASSTPMSRDGGATETSKRRTVKKSRWWRRKKKTESVPGATKAAQAR